MRHLVNFLLATAMFIGGPAVAGEPLPSWNDGPSKAGIMDFVARVTAEGGPDYVPPAERIATFDNDGTLWSEQPLYFQAIFAIDRVRAMSVDHPEWAEQSEALAAVMQGAFFIRV